MKKLLFLAFCFLASTGLSSKTRFSVEGSFLQSSVFVSNTNPSELVSYVSGFGGGIGAEFFTEERFQFLLNLDYLQKGYSESIEFGVIGLDSFDNPVLVGVIKAEVGVTRRYLTLRPAVGVKFPFSSVTSSLQIGPYAAHFLGGVSRSKLGAEDWVSHDISSGSLSNNGFDAGLSLSGVLLFLPNSKFSPFLRLRYDHGLVPVTSYRKEYNLSYILSAGVLN